MNLSATLPARFRQVARTLVDGVLPPRCLACGTVVGEPDALCGQCWAAMTFFAPPWCAVCGLPFPHPMGEGAVCAECARERASWDRARSVLRYDKHSRRLVLALKHGDRTHLAGALGGWMRRAGRGGPDRARFIPPAPAHWTPPLPRRSTPAGAPAPAHPAPARPPG